MRQRLVVKHFNWVHSYLHLLMLLGLQFPVLLLLLWRHFLPSLLRHWRS